MSKHVLSSFVAFFSLTVGSLLADCTTAVEVRAAAFHPSSHLFREIYGNFGVSYQLEAITNVWDCIDGWTSFDWYSKHGKTEHTEATTRVNIATFSFGLQYPYYICDNLSVYAGLGASIAGIRLKNKSECCNDKASKGSIGGIIIAKFDFIFH